MSFAGQNRQQLAMQQQQQQQQHLIQQHEHVLAQQQMNEYQVQRQIVLSYVYGNLSTLMQILSNKSFLTPKSD